MKGPVLIKSRLEAFSDGVIAIIITVMVLEMKIPHGADMAALKTMLSLFMCYVLSFLYLGIYWNNHHHLFHAVRHVNGVVLWANLHLLFWLSLIPFTTGWMGENNFAPLPVAIYGVVLFFAACAYFILTRVLIRAEGKDSLLAKAMGKDLKGKISIVLYVLGIITAFYNTLISTMFYCIVALMWLVPDKRIEINMKSYEI